MSRRAERAAERAASEASEAARVLQQRGQEAKAEKAVEPATEPVSEERKQEGSVDSGRVEKLLGNRPHVRAMEELVQSRQAAEPEPQKEAEPAVEPKTEPAQEASDEAQAEQPAAEPTAPKLVKQKVDGEEYEVSQEEIDAAGGERAWRIQKASENRLAKAKEALEESRKTQAQLAEFLMRQSAPAQPAKDEKAEMERLAKLVDIERFGTPEESIAAKREIAKILNPAPQQVDPNAIIAAASNRFKNEQSVERFKQEYADIWADPLLRKLAISLDMERIPQLPKDQPVDWDAHYRRIGTEIRSATGRQSQPATKIEKTQGNPSLAASDKEARKASIVNLPAGSARAELPKEDKPGTPEEERKKAIAEMRKSRGLPVG